MGTTYCCHTNQEQDVHMTHDGSPYIDQVTNENMNIQAHEHWIVTGVFVTIGKPWKINPSVYKLLYNTKTNKENI